MFPDINPLVSCGNQGIKGPNCKRWGRWGHVRLLSKRLQTVFLLSACSLAPALQAAWRPSPADFMLLGGKSLPNINPSGLGRGLSSSLLWNQTPVLCLFSHFPKCHHIFHWQSSNFTHCGLFSAHCFCRLSFFFFLSHFSHVSG